jgi:hypothetical protein
MTDRPKLPWSHSFEEAEIIISNLLWKKTHFKNVLWEVWLVKVFFQHSLDYDVSCAYPLQGANNTSIRKMNMGEYHLAWRKAIDILKHNGHILFKGQVLGAGLPRHQNTCWATRQNLTYSGGW